MIFHFTNQPRRVKLCVKDLQQIDGGDDQANGLCLWLVNSTWDWKDKAGDFVSHET